MEVEKIKKILVILPMYHPIGEEILAKEAQLIKTNDYSPANLKKVVREEKVDAIVLRGPARITREIIEEADSVKAISGAGRGLDNIDVDAATEKGIAVLNCPSVNAVSVAEHAFLLLLASAKKLLSCDNAVREGNYDLRTILRPRELTGKVLGLIGTGAIGSSLASMAKGGFKMEVKAYDPFVDPALVNSLGIELYHDMHSLLPVCDFISLHVPLTAKTKNLISDKEFDLMKPTAIIVNTARGGIIDETALTKALSEKKIAGAGLDVFCDEPDIKCELPLFNLDNVVFSPHIGGITEEATYRMAEAVAINLLTFLNGKFPESICNADEIGIAKLASD